MKTKWTQEDTETAISQGWNLSDCGSRRGMQIQRIDCHEDLEGKPLEPVFESDLAAVKFVVQGWWLGSPLCAKALTLAKFD